MSVGWVAYEKWNGSCEFDAVGLLKFPVRSKWQSGWGRRKKLGAITDNDRRYSRGNPLQLVNAIANRSRDVGHHIDTIRTATLYDNHLP
jgi:hypothetical protein